MLDHRMQNAKQVFRSKRDQVTKSDTDCELVMEEIAVNQDEPESEENDGEFEKEVSTATCLLRKLHLAF